MTRSRGPLPSGVVTFVFTDIEGSTRLFRRIGERYPPILARHHEILRGAWEETGGCEVKTEGDAFFVAYADASAAVRGCELGQRALLREPWPTDAAIRVRMGLHSGLASPRGDDYIAFAVHQVARVVSAAHGGQILATFDTAALLEAPVRAALVSLGRYRVRDFDEPIELLQVIAAGLDETFGPLRVLPADRHNIVVPPTAMIGREDDLVLLDRLLGASRVVSVVGPGGLGKTRVALEYGLSRALAWEHGAWFVDLAPLTDGALVAQPIADAIGLTVADGTEARVAVIQHLRDRRALLILDNCEHLVTSVASYVDDLIRQCPRVSVIATSRESLGLGAEHTWRLRPLVPATAAVELFADRAGLGALDVDARADLVELCRVLDGLPLAIELAAARCDVLTPGEILTRIGSHRGLLRSADPTLNPRQRSLDDTIEWSYQLLTPVEQRAFRRLAVFAADFSLEAATAAVSAQDIAAYDCPELVWSLVSKSLVVSQAAAGSTRYRMLETIRMFAGRELERAAELSEAAAHLAHFYLGIYGPHLRKVDATLLAERADDIDNLRALVPVVAGNDVEQAQTLACVLASDRRRTTPRAGLDEGYAYIALLTARTPMRAALCCAVAQLAIDCGLLDAATDLLAQAAELTLEVGTPVWSEGSVDQQRGLVAVLTGDSERARAIADEALARTESPLGRSRLYNLISLACNDIGAFPVAMEAERRSVAISVELGDLEACSIALCNLAEIALRSGDRADAARYQLDALELSLELGATRDVSFAVILAARLAGSFGAWASAIRLQTAADVALAQIGVSLYPSDRMLCDEMLTSAALHLADDEVGRSVEEGTTATIANVVGEARQLLLSVAATSTEILGAPANHLSAAEAAGW